MKMKRQRETSLMTLLMVKLEVMVTMVKMVLVGPVKSARTIHQMFFIQTLLALLVMSLRGSKDFHLVPSSSAF